MRARSISSSSSTASGVPGARRGDAVLVSVGAVLGRRPAALSPAHAGRRQALAHELDVIERAGLAEFFLICWDLMRFAKERGIPAQGRGSATSSIVSYTLGISRVEPIAHNLLFERFINPGRTTYPDVDIDFSSERREEVIQYIYRRYGPEHTGMVCNLVTYRARSAVGRSATRSVSRVRWSIASRRRSRRTTASWSGATSRPTVASRSSSAAPTAADMAPVDIAAAQGLTDAMGQLDHPRGQSDPDRGRGGRPARTLPRRRTPAGTIESCMTRPSVTSSIRWAGWTSVRRWSAGAAVEAAAQAGRPERAPAVRVSVTRTRTPMARRSRDGPWRHERRSAGPSDDEGGPGDTPASVAWLRAGRGTGYRGQLAGRDADQGRRGR